jgi:hypothetical protein
MSYNPSISSKREEKFAFLFAGPQEASPINFIKDLENMYNTLTTYYNYDPANVVAAYGGTVIPAITGAVSVADSADLQLKLNAFVAMVDSFVTIKLLGTANFNRSVVMLYFTGQGSSDSLKVSADSINSSDLASCLGFGNAGYYDVNLIMQQAFAVSFQTNINAYLNSISGANLFVCGAANTGSASGSEYTDQFTRALQFEALSSGAFADQGVTGESTPVQLQISLLQAHNFVNTKLGTSYSNYFARNGVITPFYLGVPEFLIQDSPTPAWWESEDIFLTHPDYITIQLTYPDDYYAYFATTDPLGTGNYNYINIRVRNYGTHPVRQFDVGAILYATGPSGSGSTVIATNTLKDISHVQQILLPIPVPSKPFPSTLPSYALNCMYDALTTWQNNEIRFDSAFHRCMRAKALLYGLVDMDLTNWTNIDGVNNEGQRNLDVTILSSRSKVYKVYNPFLIEKSFYLILSKKLIENEKKISWKFSYLEEGTEFKECRIREKDNIHYIEFKVSPYSTTLFKVLVTNLMKEEIKGEIRIPFEFLTALPDNGVMRAHKYEKQFPETGSFGGFTMLLSGGHSKVQGITQLSNGKPAGGYKVMIYSQDLEIKADTLSKADGSFVFENLAYGIYSVVAIKEKKKSFPKDIIVSPKSAKEKVQLVIQQ